jgi:hypothetical protein
MIALLQANPSLIGVAAAQLGDPPNLGGVNRHRSNRGTTFQPVGGRPQFAALWELESEHILSRGAVSDTFEAVGLGPIPAESTDYGFMHTVLIYHGAADIKTQGAAGDAALIASHRADLRGVRDRLRQLAWRIDEHGDPVKTDPQAMAERNHIIEELVDMLREWGAGAVRRTKTAVSAEHASNGVSRGKAPGSPALPPGGTIDQAFDRQLDDIETIGTARRPTL